MDSKCARIVSRIGKSPGLCECTLALIGISFPSTDMAISIDRLLKLLKPLRVISVARIRLKTSCHELQLVSIVTEYLDMMVSYVCKDSPESCFMNFH